MGKFFDVMQKAASISNKKEASSNKSLTDTAMRTDTKHERDIDFLFTESPKDSTTVTKPSSESSSMNELLVAGRENSNNSTSIAAEQYRMLSSQIMFPAKGPACKTIMVTSALPQEGKSVVSSNLAISIALGKQEHVLLIEGDLRRPSLAGLFGIDNTRGLSDYLAEKEELHNLLCKTEIDKLTLLPAGSPPYNPYELLSSLRMKTLLEEAKNRYHDRHIILDSTPVQIAAETSVLSKFIDGIVLIVRYGKTSRKLIQETVEKVGREMFLGVVFNGVDQQYTHSYYHYYNYYGRSKEKRFKLFNRK